MLCMEFCLALDAVGRPFVGGGEMRPAAFASANEPCIGEDAMLGVFATFEA